MTPLFHLQMSAVGITENIKGDVKKFEIWYNGKEEVYVVQVSHFIKVKTPQYALDKKLQVPLSSLNNASSIPPR